MPNFYKSKIALFTATALMMPSLGYAQQGGFLEEIVVTATKRSKTLQEIPIAVSVTTADTIEKAEIQDIADLQSVVPSLRVNTLQNSTNTNFSIRGFGNGANNPGIEPSVGVFIDGVYRSRSAASISDLPKIERVEVLRGPQSTLFGKNASAGVISVVTAKPSGEAGGKVSATVGNYGQLILSGLAEGSISENTAFSVYANSNTRDGYWKNNLSGTDLNDRDRQAFRGQLVINPDDASEIRIIADYDQIDELCCGVNNLFQSPTEVFTNAVTGATINPNNPFIESGFFNVDPRNEVENAGISMQYDRDFDNFSLTSITSYRTNDAVNTIDTDFTAADYITNTISTELETFTQEIRFTSNGSGDLDWMVGGFFFDEAVDHANTVPYGPQFRSLADALTLAAGSPNALAGIEAALGLPVGAAFFPANGAVTEDATLDNQAISIFGQLDWHLSDAMTLTVGLNYTEDDKEAAVTQTERDTFASVDLDQLGAGLIAQGLIAQGVPPQVALQQAAGAVAAGLNPLAGLKPLQFLPPFQDFPNQFEDGKTNDDELTYTIRLAYDINDTVSMYGGISTGFKASSFNLSRDARPTASTIAQLRGAGIAVNNLTSGSRFAGPEEATVLELGLKARFDRGALNVAIFDQKIEGFQSNIFSGTGFNLANAGEQSTKGLEFDLTYYPTEALQLNLAGTFLDAQYDSFVGALGPNGPADLSGQTVAGVPEVSLSLGATYNFMIGGMESYIRGDFQYDDEVQANDNIPAEIASYSVENLNLSAGISTENGLSFSIWGRNITDHETIGTGFPTVSGTGGVYGYRNFPSTYGITIAKDF